MYVEVHTIAGPNGGVNSVMVSDGAAHLVASALAIGLGHVTDARQARPEVEEARRVLDLLRGGDGNVV
jgi:hypothetical protein